MKQQVYYFMLTSLLIVAGLGMHACQSKSSTEPKVAYYKNGKKMWEGQWVNGRPMGEWKTYWDNGHPWTIKNYIAHPARGSVVSGKVQRFHYETGKLHYAESYSKDGYLEGVTKSYHEDGKTLSGLYHYQQDKLQGVVKLWDKQGKLIAHKVYDAGKIKDNIPVSQ